jgi:hypothetical protein
MAGKTTWLFKADPFCFVEIDGQWQRCRVGKKYTGTTISKNCEQYFDVVKQDPDRIDVVKARLRELKEPFHHSCGLAKLEDILEKAEKEAAENAGADHKTESVE